ncbi:MAG: hypothetical protein P4L92_23505 [Rudaea sp.]|nr:hypothetical protein [Rudaea sp.]
MKTLPLSAALLAALLAASASAQPMQPPHGPAGVPPAEELATAPDLTATQQADVRKILIQRRDAQEAAQARARAEFDALRTKERNEHERIDGQASDQLRKLLGDEGYRKFAEWDLAHRGPRGDGHGPRPIGPRGGRGNGPEHGVLPPPPPNAGGAQGAAPEAPTE